MGRPAGRAAGRHGRGQPVGRFGHGRSGGLERHRAGADRAHLRGDVRLHAVWRQPGLRHARGPAAGPAAALRRHRRLPAAPGGAADPACAGAGHHHVVRPPAHLQAHHAAVGGVGPHRGRGAGRHRAHARGRRAGPPGQGLHQHEPAAGGADRQNLQGADRPAGRPHTGHAEPHQPPLHQQRPGIHQLGGADRGLRDHLGDGGIAERAAERQHVQKRPAHRDLKGGAGGR